MIPPSVVRFSVFREVNDKCLACQDCHYPFQTAIVCGGKSLSRSFSWSFVRETISTAHSHGRSTCMPSALDLWIYVCVGERRLGTALSTQCPPVSGPALNFHSELIIPGGYICCRRHNAEGPRQHTSGVRAGTHDG